MDDKINLAAALASFTDQWAPRNVAAVNDYDVRVVHIEGEFVWHQHDDTDELFLCLDGAVEIHLRDQVVSLAPGELFVVPKGVEHKPVAVDVVPLSAMTREQLIDRILDHNRTATPEFLGQFEDDGLRLYLERLTRCSGPRTDRTGWVRKGTGRAIVAHVRMV